MGWPFDGYVENNNSGLNPELLPYAQEVNGLYGDILGGQQQKTDQQSADEFADVNLDNIPKYGRKKQGNVLTSETMNEYIKGIKSSYRSEIAGFLKGGDIKGLQKYLNKKIASGEIDVSMLKKSLKKKRIRFKNNKVIEDGKLGPQTMEALRMLGNNKNNLEARANTMETEAENAEKVAGEAEKRMVYTNEYKNQTKKEAVDARKKAKKAQADLAEKKAEEAESVAGEAEKRMVYTNEYKNQTKKEAVDARKKAEQLRTDVDNSNNNKYGRNFNL